MFNMNKSSAVIDKSTPALIRIRGRFPIGIKHTTELLGLKMIDRYLSAMFQVIHLQGSIMIIYGYCSSGLFSATVLFGVCARFALHGTHITLGCRFKGSRRKWNRPKNTLHRRKVQMAKALISMQ
jgi:hypothetical protein